MNTGEVPMLICPLKCQSRGHNCLPSESHALRPELASRDSRIAPRKSPAYFLQVRAIFLEIVAAWLHRLPAVRRKHLTAQAQVIYCTTTSCKRKFGRDAFFAVSVTNFLAAVAEGTES